MSDEMRRETTKMLREVDELSRRIFEVVKGECVHRGAIGLWVILLCIEQNEPGIILESKLAANAVIKLLDAGVIAGLAFESAEIN